MSKRIKRKKRQRSTDQPKPTIVWFDYSIHVMSLTDTVPTDEEAERAAVIALSAINDDLRKKEP